jgi:uncharacterized protein YkwD
MLRTCILFFALASIAAAQGSAAGDRSSQMSSQPTPKLLSAAQSSAREDSAAESELLAMANRSRKEAGVPPLRMNDDLIRAARAHARLMIEQRQLSHQFAGEANLLKRLHETGVPLNSVGENVAYRASAEQVFDALMNSPPHRANLLDPDFNAAGFAALWSEGQLYVVQDFVHQLPEIEPTARKQ